MKPLRLPKEYGVNQYSIFDAQVISVVSRRSKEWEGLQIPNLSKCHRLRRESGRYWTRTNDLNDVNVAL